MLPLLAQIKQKNKSIGTFIELKHNLLVSYCTYLSFYLLLRLDSATGEQVTDHQVLFKIVTLRKTLEGLSGLDAKLEQLLLKSKNKKKDKKTTKQPKDSLDGGSEHDSKISNIDDYEIEGDDNELGEDADEEMEYDDEEEEEE